MKERTTFIRTLTFTLDTQTGSDEMAPATLTITENADGTLSFTISNIDDFDNMIGDIRGLFFDLSDDALLGTLSAVGDYVTDMEQDGDVNNLGGGNNTNGVPDSPYDVGIDIGTSGQATDDIQSTTITLSSSLRDLTLDDIALESFTVRQTSVGDADGAREGSDMLYGIAPYPVDAIDDSAVLNEDETLSGNVFENDIDLDNGDADGDGIADGLTITEIDGGATPIGETVEIADGITIVINADGSYTVDANDADYLSVGETITASFDYKVDDGNGGFATATVDITIDGISDEEPPQPPTGGDNFAEFFNKKGVAQDISNVVLYLSDGEDITKVKIDGWDNGETDLDNVDLDAFIDSQFEGYELIAASVKVGNNHNKDLGPGEGQLFLIDGDEDIDYVEGGDVPEGLTADILAAHADVTFDHSDDLFA